MEPSINTRRCTYEKEVFQEALIYFIDQAEYDDFAAVYASSNPKVATVSGTGKIKAKRKGTTVITITSGSVKVKCKVKVKK